MNHKTKVLNHLRSTGPLTQRFAAKHYHCWRLADVVFKLRKDGHDIHTDMVPNRNGGQHARYSLVRLAR